MQNNLVDKIKKINTHLRNKEKRSVSRKKLRELLQLYIGTIKKAKKSGGQVLNKYSERGILGVDGSITSFGSNYPYEITLFRGLAKNTKKSPDKKDSVMIEDVFSPLVDEDRDKLLKLMEKEENPTYEGALSIYKRKRLSEIELTAAAEGLQRFKPDLVLMDGGFQRFSITSPLLWEQLKTLCIENDITIVGVIEEVSTHAVVRFLGDDNKIQNRYAYDREILFGVLNVDEWLEVHDNVQIKKDFYTCFGRFAKHPQIIGFDFLKEQASKINLDDIMNLISSLTPVNSRGIPVWIDIVDRDVRITNKDTRMLVNTFIDTDIKEKFFVPNSDRRQY